MPRKTLLLASVLILLTLSYAQAAVFSEILRAIATEAAKAVAGEAGKNAVEYFRKLFNKDATLAKQKGAPQLRDEGLDGNVRKWVIAPAGSLTKMEIAEIARTLKGLDQGRDQRISATIDNRLEEIANTQVDSKGGVLINKADGPVTVSTQSGTQGNETTIRDIRDNTNTQININSPNPTQNINQKRVLQRQGRLEHAMEGNTHVLNVILTQTKGIWDPGEKFQVDILLSGPFLDYRFVSGLPGVLMEVTERSDPATGRIYYSTRTPLINEPVILRIRSKEQLSVTQIGVSPISEE